LNQPVKFSTQLFLVTKRAGPGIFALSFGFTMADQFLTDVMQKQLMSPDGITWILAVCGLFSMLLSLAVPLFINLLIIYACLKPANGFLNSVNQALIEEFRAIGVSMLWLIVFVVPGLIKLVQFVFVPFVVALDSKYQAGERDALQFSKTIVNNNFWKVSGLLLIFSVLLPVLMTGLDQYHLFWIHPVGNLLLTLLQSFLSLIFGLVLLRLWEKNYAADV
jgi:hypothetical protein